MAYIFSDLKTKLQTQIGDPNLDSSVMGDALNYTEQGLFNTFDLTLNSAQAANSVLVGTNSLATALPSDFQRVLSLYVTSPQATDLTDYFIRVKDFRKNYPNAGTNTGYLDYWTLFITIEFVNKASVTTALKLDYVKSVPLMSASTDVPTIPASFEELLVLGSKIRIYEQKEDFDYAQQFSNRYADMVEAFTTRYSTRQVDNVVIIPGARG